MQFCPTLDITRQAPDTVRKLFRKNSKKKSYIFPHFCNMFLGIEPNTFRISARHYHTSLLQY
jgi:hypothetical protein